MYSNQSFKPKNFASVLEEVFGTGLNILHEEGLDLNSRKRFPRTNIMELENEIQIEMLIPGRSKEDIKIFTENQVLTVSYDPAAPATTSDSEDTSKEEKPREYPKYSLREFSIQAFKRSFKLNDSLDLSGIEASYNQGLLTLVVPKTVKEELQKKEVIIK